MKGFVIYSGHKIIGNKTFIFLFGRLENGKSFVIQNDFTPYFFIREKELPKIKQLISKFKIKKTDLKNFKEERVIKISSNLQSDISKLVSALHKRNIDTYEADIKPPMRFLIDNDILGHINIEGNYETAEKIDRIYKNPEISPTAFKPKLKVASIDVESSKITGNIFCVGIYSENYRKNIIVADESFPNTISCKSESELLEKFKEEIINLDPDIITGWHVIDFDLAYLRKRFAENKISFDIGRTNENAKIRVEAGFFRSSSADIPGRQVLDGLNLIKDPFIKEAPSIKTRKFESFSLESVSNEILGEGKIIKSKGKKKYDEIESLFKTDKKKLIEYNLKDCELAYNILEKTLIIDLAIERASLTGMPLNKITSSIASFDSLYIREARKRNLVSPTTKYEKKEEQITGGYVMESKPGIYDNIAVLDFKSLYPSIIKTFNIDPSSYLESPIKNTEIIESPNKAYFLNQEGILPGVIGKLHDAREKAKKEKRELASYAIKIIQNSFFGVLASPNCRYFSLKMANAITHFGQFIIKLTAKKMEEMGYEVIYSDTDSVFIKTSAETKEAELIGNNIQDKINKFYEKYVKENYNRKSFLELEFKKLYISFMLPRIRSAEKGSKKRYAGLIKLNGKEEIEVIGLEAIRGDWTEAAREFQKLLLDKIFHKEEFIQFIRSYVKKIKEGQMDEKLIYKKAITKPLEMYVKTTPPHVKAAKKLDVLDSNIIQYYVTTEGPEPIQKLRHKIDYEHYIKKQIAPIADTLLSFFNKTFEGIIHNSRQTKLF